MVSWFVLSKATAQKRVRRCYTFALVSNGVDVMRLAALTLVAWLVGCAAGEPGSYNVREVEGGNLRASNVSWEQCVVATRERPDLYCEEA